MSDDFDSLFDTAPSPAVAAQPALPLAAAPASPAVAAPEPAPAPVLWLPLYKAGAAVHYEGERHTVNHVHISRNGLFVRLHGKDGIVPAEKVDVPLTCVALPPNAYQAPALRALGFVPPGPARTK